MFSNSNINLRGHQDDEWAGKSAIYPLYKDDATSQDEVCFSSIYLTRVFDLIYNQASNMSHAFLPCSGMIFEIFNPHFAIP